MVCVNEELLEQVMIEDWTYTDNGGHGTGVGSWAYNGWLGTGELTDGSYGVSDSEEGAREENST